MTHPAIVSFRRLLALASVPAADPARIAAEPGVSVRESGGVLELSSIALEHGDGPTLAELEAAFGRARELPRLPGPAYAILTFDRGPGRVAVFAHVDDVSGRAVELILRRDRY
jgi:hypothetical protein